MKFIADCMLGKLAKWLKILGFDTLFFSRIGDDELLSIAQKENRVLLTRDTGLLERAHGHTTLFINSEEYTTQVRQVLDRFCLRDEVSPYSRCIECNLTLKNISRSKAKNLVTPFVYESNQAFSLCPRCGRLFWRGTHHKDMENKISKLVGKRQPG